MDDTISKTVQVVGYADDGIDTRQDMIEACYPERGYDETEESQKSEYIFLDGDGVKTIDWSLYNKLKEQGLEHYVDKESYTTETQKWDLNHDIRVDFHRIVEDIFEGYDGVEHYYNASFKGDDSDHYVISGYVNLGLSQLLKPLNEQEKDDVFVESEGERPSIHLRLKLNECDLTTAMIVEDVIAPALGRHLAELKGVGRIRYAKCFKETKESYSCPRL